MDKSLISVIVPCYNQSEFLDESLGSIFFQTYTNWECIIVNDGSTDETSAIAKKWQAKDKRFKYIWQKNAGLSAARNTGLAAAKGNFIQFLDADDVITPDKFQLSINFLEKDCSVVVSNFQTFTYDSQTLNEPYCNLSEASFSFNSLLVKWPVASVPIHCGIFQSELLKEFRFPEQLKAYEDWVMWLYLFKKKPKIKFVDIPSALYRQQSHSLTMNKELMDNNLREAVVLVKEMIPQEGTYIYLSFQEMQEQYKEIRKLKRELREIETSRSFILLKKMKNMLPFRYFKAIKG